MHDREGAEQMEMIYNWILKLSFFAVLGSVILQMIPDHGFQKYVRFVLGLILAAMLVVPVLELFDKKAAFEEIYHKNVKIRMKNYNAEQGHRKCTSILDFIEKVLNMLDELYDLAVKLFESDFTQLMQEMHLLRMTDEEYEDEEYWKRVL